MSSYHSTLIMSSYHFQRFMAYGILLGGWSMTLYFLQYVWENVQTLLESYYWHIVGYFGMAGVLSFAYCYYKVSLHNPFLFLK